MSLLFETKIINYCLNLEDKKNYISLEYYYFNKSIFVTNIIVVYALIQWYDILSSLIVIVIFCQFHDLLGEHKTLRFSSYDNFSTFIEPLNTFISCILDDSTYQKLSDDTEHIVQWLWTIACHYIPHRLRHSSICCAHLSWCNAITSSEINFS
jgi:hypothetical protein